MPRPRMKIKTIREILRLDSMNFSTREIGRSVGKGSSSVNDIVRRARGADLEWSAAKEIDDQRLEEMLYSNSGVVREGNAEPDFPYVQRELRKKGVTRQLLWEEYRNKDIGSRHYSYPQFCKLYNKWLRKNSEPSMRQTHKAGEKCFVDYAGMKVGITGSDTGEVSAAQIFVGVMGASNYIFAEAVESQSLESWLGSHTRMVEFFGGVPRVIVPDNLRSGVTRASRYDPETNSSYLQWADHYGAAIIPARPLKPKDKAKAESGVQIVERSVLAVIRNEEFFSLGQLNSRVKQIMAEVNTKPFQKLPGCRREQFEKIDLPEMGELPANRYEYADIKRAKVNIDYHVEHKKCLYSVPYNYRGERVEVHASQNLVSIYFRNKLIAQHKRTRPGRPATEPAHMPEGHRRHRQWNPESLRNWADKLGEEVRGWVDAQLASRDHPEQAYRTFLGLRDLARRYPGRRLNDACGVANKKGLMRIRQISEVLRNSMDKLPLLEEEEGALPQDHKNIRGPRQFR